MTIEECGSLCDLRILCESCVDFNEKTCFCILVCDVHSTFFCWI
jgi:hypothetical protein